MASANPGANATLQGGPRSYAQVAQNPAVKVYSLFDDSDEEMEDAAAEETQATKVDKKDADEDVMSIDSDHDSDADDEGFSKQQRPKQASKKRPYQNLVTKVFTVKPKTDAKGGHMPTLPDAFKFKESDGPWYGKFPGQKERDPDIAHLTRNYRGQDAPASSELKHRGSGLCLNSKASAIVVFHDTFDPRTKQPVAFGCGLSKESLAKAGKQLDDFGTEAWIKIEPELVSQCSSLKLMIDREDQSSFTAHIFPGTIARDEHSSIKGSFLVQGGQHATQRSAWHPELADRRSVDSLMEYTLKCWSYQDKPSMIGKGPVPQLIQFTGITPAAVADILKRGDKYASAKNKPAPLARWEKLVWYLRRFPALSIFRAWPAGAEQQFKLFQEWFEAAFAVAARFGYDWFARLQLPNLALTIDKNVLASLLPPRHLALEVEVEYEDIPQGGRVRKAKVVAMKSYLSAPDSISRKIDDHKAGTVHPNVSVMEFRTALAVVREHQFQMESLRKIFKDLQWKLVAAMRPHQKYLGAYLVAIRATESAAGRKTHDLVPKIGSRLRLTLRSPNWMSDKVTYTFHGSVVDDISNCGAPINLMVYGQDLGISKIKDYTGKVELISDPTPSTRQLNALQTLSRSPITREYGFDIRAFFLQVPRSISGTGSLAHQVKDKSGDKGVAGLVKKFKKAAELNDLQSKCLEHALTTESGYLGVKGPPGTGKTFTLAAIALELILSGYEVGDRRPVLYVCAANYAVDQGMIKFEKVLAIMKPYLDRVGIDIKSTRYAGTLLEEHEARQLREDRMDVDDTPPMDDDVLGSDTGYVSESDPGSPDEDAREKISQEVNKKYRAEFPIGADEPEDEYEERIDLNLDEALEDHLQKLRDQRIQTRLDRRLQYKKAKGAKMLEADKLAREAREKTRVIWEVADEVDPKKKSPMDHKAFYRTRRAYIEGVAATATAVEPLVPHQHARLAVEYLTKLDQIKAGSLSPSDLTKLRARVDDLEVTLTGPYIQDVVDIVFCTNSTAAQGLLAFYGNFKIICQDEAALTSLVDTAIPVSVFRNTVETYVQAGDGEQHEPMAQSEGHNETVECLKYSQFTVAEANKQHAGDFIQLLMQYRMHPSIGSKVSRVFYGGELIHAGATLHTPETPLKDMEPAELIVQQKWRTMEAYLAGLSPAIKDFHCWAMDVRGDGTESIRVDGHSWQNELEAAEIVAFILGALDFPPPPATDKLPAGLPLEASDFLITSPYNAQVRLVKSKALETGLRLADNRITVENTRVIQGGEGLFNILSLAARNDEHPLSIGMLGESHNLCVSVSRAKQMLLIMGNFSGWCPLIKAEEPQLVEPSKRNFNFGRYVELVWQEGGIAHVDDVARWRKGDPIQPGGFFNTSLQDLASLRQQADPNSYFATQSSD
nr:hypothetical protein B0A51_08334 [Rachicladosporium sp. CCFEE 5018]